MRETPHIVAIILAAGLSSRMGESKQLMRIDGLSMLDWSIQAALDAGFHRPMVILGHQASKIREESLLLDQCDVVVNPTYRGGLSTSLIYGVNKSPQEATAFLFIHADQPLIDGRLLKNIVGEFTQTGADILYPTYRNRRGNPVIVNAKLRNRLLKAKGDSGAKFLFNEPDINTIAFPVSTPAVIADVDTKEDVNTILGLLSIRQDR